MPGWKLVVVGDRKTPGGFEKLNCVYLSPDAQDAIDHQLSELIGWNNIQRRNMGFVYAIQHGAEIVATVDDDNDPLDNWGQDIFIGKPVEVDYHSTDLPAFDPLWATNNQHLWHRGFPVQWVNRRESDVMRAEVVADVQAGLWDGDPDIDGHCRLLNPEQVTFTNEHFAADAPSPFNSQNTILSREAMKWFFCFPHTGRMDDIYGSYVCQSHGFKVVYEPPTVYQVRIGHDPVSDMEKELDGYRNCHKLIKALQSDPDSWVQFVPPKAAAAFSRYRELIS